MDYVQIKAMIEVRLKQWKEQAEKAEQLHADIATISALEGSVQACHILLQDMETAHDILDRQ